MRRLPFGSTPILERACRASAVRVLLAVSAAFALVHLAGVSTFGAAAAPQRAGSTGHPLARPQAAAPPPFVANPFAAEFVITGAEDDLGDHYVPANGDGTFGALSNIPGLPIVDGVDVADVDGDGDLDFVLVEGTSGDVYLYANQGSGSFVPARIASGISTAFSTSLRIADFNGDARPDFVVGDARTLLGVQVFLQNGGGRFRRAGQLDLAWNEAPGAGDTGPTLMGVAAGDIDRDGRPDIALLGYEGEGAGEVRLYRGNGRGRFDASALLFDLEDDFGVNLLPTGLAALDIEADGDLDLVAGGADGRIVAYINSGTGQFAALPDPVAVVDGQSGIDAYDADQDGDHDLVIAVGASRTLYYVENLGGTFAAPVVAATLGGFGIGVGAPPIDASDSDAAR